MANPEHPESSDSPRPAVAELIDPTSYGLTLADAVKGAMPRFVQRIVLERVPDPDFDPDFDLDPDPDNRTRLSATLREDVTRLIETLTESVDRALRAFFATDVDTQQTTPLSIIRNHMPMLTEFLWRTGCSPAERDPFDESTFPTDVFAVGPYAWTDFGETVHEASLRWGAAKAMAHRQRHRSH
jgi:hypothetical protein